MAINKPKNNPVAKKVMGISQDVLESNNKALFIQNNPKAKIKNKKKARKTKNKKKKR